MVHQAKFPMAMNPRSSEPAASKSVDRLFGMWDSPSQSENLAASLVDHPFLSIFSRVMLSPLVPLQWYLLVSLLNPVRVLLATLAPRMFSHCLVSYGFSTYACCRWQ